MKNSFLTLLLFFSILTFSQKERNNDDLILFQKAIALQELIDIDLDYLFYQKDSTNLTNDDKVKRKFAEEIKETILDKAIDNYDELIKEFPKSKLIFRALNNKGYAELELDYDDEAKKTFLKILHSDANDNEKGGIGSGIMGEPYANYKNRASKKLAELELNEQNYKEAINYLDQTRKYPYRHFCGNEFAADEIYMAEMYSKCYLGLNQPEKAYDILLPCILENGLANNSEIIKMGYDSLLKSYTKEDLKNQFENSFKNVTSKIEKRNKDEYTFYYINFLNREIKLSSWKLHEMLDETEKEKVLSEILNESEFYKMLSK